MAVFNIVTNQKMASNPDKHVFVIFDVPAAKGVAAAHEILQRDKMLMGDQLFLYNDGNGGPEIIKKRVPKIVGLEMVGTIEHYWKPVVEGRHL